MTVQTRKKLKTQPCVRNIYRVPWASIEPKNFPEEKNRPGGLFRLGEGFLGGGCVDEIEGVRPLHLRGSKVPILRGLNGLFQGGWIWLFSGHLICTSTPDHASAICTLTLNPPSEICTTFPVHFAPISSCHCTILDLSPNW